MRPCCGASPPGSCKGTEHSFVDTLTASAPGCTHPPTHRDGRREEEQPTRVDNIFVDNMEDFEVVVSLGDGEIFR